MKKAVFYARVSSDIQKTEGSIESQIDELRRQIEKAGHKLVKEYADNGFSGALLDRPAMNELRNDLKRDIFETIYILNADRIARDVTYQNIIVGEILRYKKQLIINGKDYIHNPENKFTLTVLGAVSELERAKLIERVTRGRQHRLKQGILLGNGHHLYGYRYVKKTVAAPPSYAINSDEAKVVRYVFETYAKGQIGIRTLVQRIEQLEVPRIRGRNRLRQSNLKWMLQNETYTGIRYFNTMKQARVPQDPLSHSKQAKREYTDRSEWIGIKIPAIISKEIFEKVQKRLEYNRTCWRNSKRPQLLSNFVWCDICGSRCFAYRRRYQDRRTRSAKIYRRIVYKCRAKHSGNHTAEINSHVIESCVFDMIKETMLIPEKLHGCIDFLRRRKRANHIKIEKQLKEVDKRVEAITQQKKRIVDLYAAGDLEREEFSRRIGAYDKELGVPKEKRDQLLQLAPLFQKTELIGASIGTYCYEVKKRYEQCVDFETKRQFLLEYISKVAYSRPNKVVTRMKLYGSIPIKVDLDGVPEIIPVEFKIERKLGWHEFMTRIPKRSPENQEYWRAPLPSMRPSIKVSSL